MSSSAHMPGSVKAPYRRVAIVELKEGFEGIPKMISLRAKGIESIVYNSGALHAGGGEGTAFAKARREAEYVCKRLNDAPLTLEAIGQDPLPGHAFQEYLRKLFEELK